VRRRSATVVALTSLTLAVLLAWWLLGNAAGGDGSSRAQPPSARPDATAGGRAIESRASEPLLPAAAAPDPAPVAHVAEYRLPREPFDGRLTLDADGARLSGRVVDETGRPIPGAVVLLVHENWGHHGEFFEFESDRDVSDAAGRFLVRLDSWADPVNLRLHVAAQGWPPWEGRVAPLGDGQDVVLGPVEWLPVQVSFDDGEPVADATLRLGDAGWEIRRDAEADIAGATTVGRTDGGGRALIPVSVRRRDLSLIVEHEQHAGRHEVPMAAWRADRASFSWTLTVPRLAAFELQLTDWPGERVLQDPDLHLSLRPYERRPDGSVALVEDSPFFGVPSPVRGARVLDGRARLGRLDAPAYEITLSDDGRIEVIEALWVARPGLTTRPYLTPRPHATPKPSPSLLVELALAGGEGSGWDEVWSGVPWTIEAVDAKGRKESTQAKSPGDTLRFNWLDGPVRLSILELGEAGVRTDVPPRGTYRFELGREVVRAATGALRVEFALIEDPPRHDKVDLLLQPAGSNHSIEVKDAVEARGIRPESYRLHVRARGVDEARQAVEIVAGRTLAVQARPAPPPDKVLVRGRVRMGDEGEWARVEGVRFLDADTGVEVEVWPVALGQQSFSAELAPGRYRGEVRLARLMAPEAVERRLHDVNVLDSLRLEPLPVRGTFECEVRAGVPVDLEVSVDVGSTPLVSVTAPEIHEARAAGSAGEDLWTLSLARSGSDETEQATWIGRWPDEPVTLRVAAGDFVLVAERRVEAPSQFPDRMEARFSVPVGVPRVDVVLEPVPAGPGPGDPPN